MLVVSLLIGLVLVAAGIVEVVRHLGEITSKFYSGKVVFETAGEYERFKRAIGDKRIYWFESYVLSSGPPIVVSFSARGEPDYEFPYGEVEVNTKLYGGSPWHILCFVFGGLFLLFAVIIMLFGKG